jgi:hypothetical protein
MCVYETSFLFGQLIPKAGEDEDAVFGTYDNIVTALVDVCAKI